MGPPGSGKGTQASVISQKLGVAHIATGDMFREAVKRGDELGAEAKAYMDQGLLVPDEITIRMLLQRISEGDCANGYILDGFPRTLEQARALDRALGQQGQSVDVVVYFRVSTEELVRRLSGRLICRNCQAPYHRVTSPPKVDGVCDRCGGELYQRADDSPETVRKRLDMYFSETAALKDYYRGAGKLVEIDGEESVDDVTEEALAALSKA